MKAAWNIFGDSYRYRKKYNEYKAKRMAEEKQVDGQIEMPLEEMKVRWHKDL